MGGYFRHVVYTNMYTHTMYRTEQVCMHGRLRMQVCMHGRLRMQVCMQGRRRMQVCVHGRLRINLALNLVENWSGNFQYVRGTDKKQNVKPVVGSC